MTLMLKLIKPENNEWYNEDPEEWLKKRQEEKKKEGKKYDSIVVMDKDLIMVNNSPIILGRDEKADVAFVPKSKFKEISQLHAMISQKGNDWQITDLRSRNHTYILENDNDKTRVDVGDRGTVHSKIPLEVSTDIPTQLGNNDIIFLGNPAAEHVKLQVIIV